jgi:Tfp pilus assembly protein PilF
MRGWAVGVGVIAGALAGLSSSAAFSEERVSKGDAAVALRSARLYVQQQLWDKAKEQLEIVVKGDPSSAEAHYLLGALYADQDSADAMNRHFEQALRLKPKKYERDVRSWRDKLWAQHYNSGVRAYQKDRLEEAL